MVRALLVGILVVSMVASCGKDDAAPQVAANAAAGKVVDVSGKVGATRNGAARQLAVGSEVFADDVIDTAGDGSIVIELFHNNARWAMEASLKSRVDESVAWGLEKQAVAKGVEHATSAAGRHGDRQAADTKASSEGATTGGSAPITAAAELDGAQADREREARSDSLKNEQAAAHKGMEAAKAARKVGAKTSKDAQDHPLGVEQPKPDKNLDPAAPPPPPPPPPPPTGTSSSSCDEVSCALGNNAGACCAKFKQRGKNAKPPAEPALAEQLDRTMIVEGIGKVKARVLACGDKFSATGVVKVTVAVDPAGQVSSATIKATPDPALGSCVADVIKQATFAKTRTGGTFSFPFPF